MTDKSKDLSERKSKLIEDLEGLTEEELDDVLAGACDGHSCCISCCKTCGCGGGCGTCATEHEANIIGQKGDIDLNPTRREGIKKLDK